MAALSFKMEMSGSVATHIIQFSVLDASGRRWAEPSCILDFIGLLIFFIAFGLLNQWLPFPLKRR